MIALSVQTLLLMAAAYFIGAALACLVRRTLFAGLARAPAERRVDPFPEVAQRAASATRFGRGAEPQAPPPLPHGPAKPATTAAGPADDLKRIKLIGAELEASLNQLGVSRYEQIAAWLQPDVKRLSQALGQALGPKGRINQENWIEQAQILAKGGETHYSSRRARGEAANAEPTPDEGERRAMDAASASLPRPMSRGGVAAAVVTPPMPPAAAPAAPPSSAVSASPPRVEERAAFADRSAMPAAATPGPAVPMRPAPPASSDNLQRIGGIGAEAEQSLQAQGVSRYSQIAQWSPADVERFDRHLKTGGRIARENWIEQAQILSRGGDTAYSRDYDRRAGGDGALLPTKLGDAIREHASKAAGDPQRAARTDLGALRSVRSEAFQHVAPGAEQPRPPAQNRVVRSAEKDDLKRIRGIGVLIEKKLNSMGMVAYEQIANWTAEDIDRVSQSLDFKGRIERENWIEQARILASGGATEFSRRVDRGEVETSRAKP